MVVPWLAILVIALILYTFAFFRDPERLAPSDPEAVVAAADGGVAGMLEIQETEVLKSSGGREGVFLSVFDVDTNGSATGGRMRYRKHREGL